MKIKSHTITFDDDGYFLVEIQSNKQQQRIFKLPHATSHYDLIYALIDGLINRSLRNDFNFEGDEIAQYYRLAFSLLVPEITLQTEEQKKYFNKKGPKSSVETKEMTIDGFDLIKRYLDYTGAKIAKKMQFLGLKKDVQLTSKYYSEDSDKTVSQSESDDSDNNQPGKYDLTPLKEFIDPLELPDIESQRDSLNSSITNQDLSDSRIDEETLATSRILVPGFRGLHYMTSRFSDEARHAWHTSTRDKTGDIALFSEAAIQAEIDLYRDAQSIPHLFTSASPTYNRIHKQASQIRKELRSLKHKDHVILAESEPRLFNNLVHALQHIYTNGIIKAQRILRHVRVEKNKYLQLPNGYNPFVSESERPEHSMRYVLGLKSLYERAALRPCYDANGKPRFPYLGEVHVTLRDPKVVMGEDERHLLRELSSKTDVKPTRVIGPELEATAFGLIPGEQVVHTQIIKAPKFNSFYKKKYLKEFGLTKEKFKYFKKKLANTTVGTDKRRNVEDEILNFLQEFHSYWLWQIANDKANDQGCSLVCLDSDHQFSLELPHVNNVSVDEYKEVRKKLAQKLYEAIKKRKPKEKKIIVDVKATSKSLKMYRVSESEFNATLKTVRESATQESSYRKMLDMERTPVTKPYKPRVSLSQENTESTESDNDVKFFTLKEMAKKKDAYAALMLKQMSYIDDVEEAIARSLLDIPANAENLKALLKAEATKWGFKCIDVSGDGNCFYHAVIDQIKNIPQFAGLTHKKLRQLVLEHLLSNIDAYAGFSDESSKKALIERVLLPGNWATDYVVAALANTLRVTIVIIRSDAEEPQIYRVNNPVQTLYLGNEVGWHFQSLAREAGVEAESNIDDLVNDAQADTLDTLIPNVIRDAELLERACHADEDDGHYVSGDDNENDFDGVYVGDLDSDAAEDNEEEEENEDTDEQLRP